VAALPLAVTLIGWFWPNRKTISCEASVSRLRDVRS
jgi:hypothetical protein